MTTERYRRRTEKPPAKERWYCQSRYVDRGKDCNRRLTTFEVRMMHLSGRVICTDCALGYTRQVERVSEKNRARFDIDKRLTSEGASLPMAISTHGMPLGSRGRDLILKAHEIYCPSCGAIPFERCVTKNGRYHPSTSQHRARWLKAQSLVPRDPVTQARIDEVLSEMGSR